MDPCYRLFSWGGVGGYVCGVVVGSDTYFYMLPETEFKIASHIRTLESYRKNVLPEGEDSVWLLMYRLDFLGSSFLSISSSASYFFLFFYELL